MVSQGSERDQTVIFAGSQAGARNMNAITLPAPRHDAPFDAGQPRWNGRGGQGDEADDLAAAFGPGQSEGAHRRGLPGAGGQIIPGSGSEVAPGFRTPTVRRRWSSAPSGECRKTGAI